MSARKERPAFGALVTNTMSHRDMSAALGVSTGEMNRWMQLSRIPEGEFERRLNQCGNVKTASAILSMSAPVPARGRVERAAAIIRHMTAIERSELLDLLQRGGNHG